ncbi:ATP-dependent DNA helicase PIF1-like [Senna tora]|uniref:ATP-dependent DNA helicase PIF1-like n=1 Tax=Senna tora TaxID=362788 RepID=A0A834SZF4_9FABA|nr:ATP-dependent DNA helicase PIF1-like [Senna tora]
MRLGSENLEAGEHGIRNFADWILKIGNDDIGEEINDEESEITIPNDILISKFQDLVQAIVNNTYPLAPTLGDVASINNYMLSLLPGEEVTYLISNNICVQGKDSQLGDVYTTEFLNTISGSGLPYHQLKLKAEYTRLKMAKSSQASTQGLTSDEVSQDIAIWVQAVGGKNKKGYIFGAGHKLSKGSSSNKISTFETWLHPEFQGELECQKATLGKEIVKRDKVIESQLKHLNSYDRRLKHQEKLMKNIMRQFSVYPSNEDKKIKGTMKMTTWKMMEVHLYFVIETLRFLSRL